MRIIRGLLIAVVVLVGLALVYAWRLPYAQVEPPKPGAFPAEKVKAGANLSAIGNCSTCHTRDGGAPFSGGRPINTPFGLIYATNITPDAETGIGRWSEAAFVRAMREGVSRDGRHLYPAFPYDHMAKMTDPDIAAVYAFIMTRQPVAAKPPANDVAFPFNIRMLVAGWKLLYHDRDGFKPEPTQSAEWNRGAYLVQGLAHCGACHTPRNVFGAEDKVRAFAGAEVDGWSAPALSPDTSAAVPWTAERLTDYLSKGSSPLHGVAAGPMAPVIRNLSQAAISDVKAMATYVATLAGHPTRERQDTAQRVIARAEGSRPPTRAPAASGPGAAIYAGACAQCHGEAGRAPLVPALNLALSTSVRGRQPNNLVRIIFGGIGHGENTPGPYMPPFADALTDRQAIDLVEFIRASFTDRAAFDGVDVEVKKAR